MASTARVMTRQRIRSTVVVECTSEKRFQIKPFKQQVALALGLFQVLFSVVHARLCVHDLSPPWWWVMNLMMSDKPTDSSTSQSPVCVEPAGRRCIEEERCSSSSSSTEPEAHPDPDHAERAGAGAALVACSINPTKIRQESWQKIQKRQHI
jgi:hypothetical protein